MQSTPHSTWMQAIWRDITGKCDEPLPAYFISTLNTGFNNLPSFLQDFCYQYYVQQKTLAETAKALGIAENLARQRWVVSVALFKMLLACKPKNPV